MAAEASHPEQKGFLGVIERIGNKVPHPVMLFLYLMIGVVILSHILYLAGVSVTEQIATPVPTESVPDFYEDTVQPSEVIPQNPYNTQYVINEQTISIRSLLTTEGIRFIFTSFVPNFAGFGVVAVVLVAMMGAGVAEESGLFNALIRKLVAVTPGWAIT